MGQWALVNPGFESGIFTGWNNTNGGNVTASGDGGTVHSGALALKVIDSVAGQDAYYRKGNVEEAQLVSAIGVTYTLSAWVNVAAFTAGALNNRGLALVVDGVLTSSDITGTTGGWTQLTVPPRTATTAAGMQIRLYVPQATLYWDDITFADNLNTETIPVPAAPFW